MKIVKILILYSFLILLSGCVNFFHFLEIDEKSINVQLKVTISKILLNMASSMGGSSNSDTDYFKNFENNIPDDFNGKYEKIDDEMEQGVKLTFITDGYKSYENTNLIPYYDNKNIIIGFPEGGSLNSSDESSSYAKAFLSTAKYTLLIKSQKIIKSIYVLSDDIKKDLIINNLSSDLYLVEFPLVLWFTSKTKMKFVIEF
jgi:hypothetical protein